MLEWLGNEALSLEERAKAYALLKGLVHVGGGLDEACHRILMGSMLEQLGGQRVLLTTSGKLVKTGLCTMVPKELFQVWEPGQLQKLFVSDGTHLLASEVGDSARSALKSHGWLAEVSSDGVLEKLQEALEVPTPASWPQVHALWSFVQDEVGYWSSDRQQSLKIVPVDGSKTLHPAKDVVRLSSRRDLLSDADWKFVMDFAPTLNADWLAWISKRAPKKSQGSDDDIDPGYDLLQELDLDEPSSVDRIAAQASLRIFTGGHVALADCVRIAHIMCALGATIPDGFRYVTKDLQIRGAGHVSLSMRTDSSRILCPQGGLSSTSFMETTHGISSRVNLKHGETGLEPRAASF